MVSSSACCSSARRRSAPGAGPPDGDARLGGGGGEDLEVVLRPNASGSVLSTTRTPNTWLAQQERHVHLGAAVQAGQVVGRRG